MAPTIVPSPPLPVPMSPEMVADVAVAAAPADVMYDHAGRPCWVENRSGRNVIESEGVTFEDFDVRALVNYGGGDCTPHPNGGFVVAHAGDQRLYRVAVDVEPTPVTPLGGQAAAPDVSPDGRLVAYVHRTVDDRDRVLIAPFDGGEPRVVAEDADFFADPVFSPDGGRLAFVCWNHPDMPWDASEVVLVDLEQGTRRRLALGPGVAVQQPVFTPDGTVLFIGNPDGVGRVLEWDPDTEYIRSLSPLGLDASLPGWTMRLRRFAVSPCGRWVTFAASQAGVDTMYRGDRRTGLAEPINELAGWTHFRQLVAATDGDRVAFIGSAPCHPPVVLEYDFLTRRPRVVGTTIDTSMHGVTLAACEPVWWMGGDGQMVHGMYYPPVGGSTGGPAVVVAHGGPTDQERAAFNPTAQFLATNGCAVLAVNYHGSTGYGRDYLRALDGRWGELDVSDCAAGARFLAESGRAAADQIAVLGASAGGFSALLAACAPDTPFAAAVVLYGVSDPLDLAGKLPKFESRYLDRLIGPLPVTEAVYRARTPLTRVTEIRIPLAVFHGTADEVITPAQTSRLVDAVRANGVSCSFHLYPDEGHGWRRAETVAHFHRELARFLSARGLLRGGF